MVATTSSYHGSNRTATLFRAAALVTLSVTVISYRCFWYKPKKEHRAGDGDQRSRTTHDGIKINPPLRNISPSPGEQPKIVYLTGIDKQTTQEQLAELFSSSGAPPIEMDASEVSFQKGGGRAWALYQAPNDACRAVAALHGKVWYGCVLCARLEWGVEKDGKRITDKTTHTAIVRGIQRRRGTPKKKQTNEHKGGKPKNKNAKKNKTKAPRAIDDNNCPPSSFEQAATYSHNSISIGEIEYPFPSGIYSTKLIQRLTKAIGTSMIDDNNFDDGAGGQQHEREQETKLLRLLSDISILGCGSVHRYAKEISEVFAMVDALERGIKLAFGVGALDLQQHPVVCYCLGDGKYPIGAAALELFLPKISKNWKFIAIDPLLPKNKSNKNNNNGDRANAETSNSASANNATSVFHDRIEIFSGFSQNYSIKPANGANGSAAAGSEIDAPGGALLSIAIACHSHAPLEEFWERMPKPKLCVALPCCAQYSELPKETPLLEYDNFEVYSPKRKIKVFFTSS